MAIFSIRIRPRNETDPYGLGSVTLFYLHTDLHVGKLLDAIAPLRVSRTVVETGKCLSKQIVLRCEVFAPPKKKLTYKIFFK